MVLRRAQKDAAGAPGFPFRNATDMYTSGEWATLMLPVHTHLPMLDCAGPLYLKRNFSVLGFSCDNWLNHSVNLTILPAHAVDSRVVLDGIHESWWSVGGRPLRQ